jgi:hypothetical protein
MIYFLLCMLKKSFVFVTLFYWVFSRFIFSSSEEQNLWFATNWALAHEDCKLEVSFNGEKREVKAFNASGLFLKVLKQTDGTIYVGIPTEGMGCVLLKYNLAIVSELTRDEIDEFNAFEEGNFTEISNLCVPNIWLDHLDAIASPKSKRDEHLIKFFCMNSNGILTRTKTKDFKRLSLLDDDDKSIIVRGPFSFAFTTDDGLFCSFMVNDIHSLVGIDDLKDAPQVISQVNNLESKKKKQEYSNASWVTAQANMPEPLGGKKKKKTMHNNVNR